MERTIIDGRSVIITAGGLVDGVRIAGVFADEHDARADDADALAVGIIAWDRLTPEQRMIAERNSETL